MDEEEFYMLEDHYLFNMDLSEISALVKGKNKTIFAAILIIIGIAMLISNFMSLLNAILPWELYWRLESILGNIPRIGIALIIIWIGMRMIQGKRLELHPHMKEKVFVRTEPYAQNDGHTKADEQKQEEWTGTVVDLKKESPDNSDSEMKQLFSCHAYACLRGKKCAIIKTQNSQKMAKMSRKGKGHDSGNYT